MKRDASQKFIERAAAALDATHDVGERGPRTFQARAIVARWLDEVAGPGGVTNAVKHLERVARSRKTDVQE